MEAKDIEQRRDRPQPRPSGPHAAQPEHKGILELEAEGASFEGIGKTDGWVPCAAQVQEGDVKNGSVMAGQIAGMIRKRQSCREIILELVEETETLLKGAEKWEK